MPEPGQPAAEPADRIDELVAEFGFRREADPSVDLEAFVALQPEGVRARLRGLCEELARLHGVLSSVRPGAPRPAPARLGPYRVLRPVGRGAMAEVFLARDEGSGEELALKVLRVPAGAVRREVARFRREAEVLQKLRHPAIARVRELGEDQGKLYIAMDFVDGRSLRAQLDEQRQAAGLGDGAEDGEVHGVDLARAASVAAELASALHAAHEHRVIHRDLKPDNVLLDRQGRPHLLDFGLARDLAAASISEEGDLAGTPYYMSPEAARGERAELGPTADVFSLGVLLYELVTLRRPFRGKGLEAVLEAIEAARPAEPRRLNPEVGADLEAICLRALQREPADRYPTAAAMEQDLRAALALRALDGAPRATDSASRIGGTRRAGGWRRAVGVLPWVLALALLAWPVVRTWLELAALPAPEDVLDLGLAEASALRQQVRALADESLPVLLGAQYDLMALDGALAARASIEWRAAAELHPGASGPDGLPLSEEQRVATELALRSRLVRAGALLAHDSLLELRAAESAWWPRFVISAALAEQQVTEVLVRRLDAFHLAPTGPWQRLPVGGSSVAPGTWQVLLRGHGGEQLEFIRRALDLGRETRLPGRLRPPDGDALAFEPSTFAPEASGSGGGDERLALPAFALDRRPVTRAAYLAFVAATGGAPPPSGDGAATADGPVTGVAFEEARAYAAWCGKRLPTLAEWERALQLAPDVAMAGLREWTETPLVERHDGAWRIRPGVQRVSGDTAADAPASQPAPLGAADLGFRCASTRLD